MPFVKPKNPAPTVFEATLDRAAGSAADFFVFGFCPDLDELAIADDPAHEPTTFVFRYTAAKRSLAGEYPRRLQDLWQRGDGTIMAVGDTDGYVELRPTGLSEISLGTGPRVFTAVWGASDAHIFVAGAHPSFILYQNNGRWHELELPSRSAPISAINGLSETDVYFAGEDGQVLHFDGREVRRLSVPTRRYLTSVKRLSATDVCMVGYDGTLLVGNRDRWRHVVTETHTTLLSHAVLDNRIYYVADKQLWSTDGTAPATSVLRVDARWLSGLTDALVLG